jgi:hypothetical protein
MKNLLELKNARRVLVEANVLEDYDGFAIVITPRNQSRTAPWSTVTDVALRYNWIQRVSSVLNVSRYDEYHPSRPTERRRERVLSHRSGCSARSKGREQRISLPSNGGPIRASLLEHA